MENDWIDDALFTVEVKKKLRQILHLGFHDAFRSIKPASPGFTYWDYGSSFKNNIGVRIDHFLMSPYAMDLVDNLYVDKEPRSWERPSDHTPLIAEIEI